VYGVYDSSAQPFSVRMRDFFIDRARVKVQDKSYFYHLLGVMLDAGIPIVKSLQVLAKKTENERFARVINTMAYDVERGRKMSQSMRKFPEIFGESEIGIVTSGEAIGNLQHLLFKLSKQTKRTHDLLMKVRGALIYPATVLIALFVSGFIVVTTVIPRLDEFFVQADVEMPFLTDLVLTVGRFLIDFSWLLLILFAFFAFVLSFYVTTDIGKKRIDILTMQIPYVHHIVRRLNVAKFVQLLSLLVESGVPINEAIRISGEAMNNFLYRDFLKELKHRVEAGEKIALAMADAPFLFPDTVITMISVGENTGQLALISEKLATHYEEEVEHSLDTFTTLLEPAVTVLVGLAVAVLALALLGPIFSLSSLVA